MQAKPSLRAGRGRLPPDHNIGPESSSSGQRRSARSRADAHQSVLGDKLKKRMSMRYADTSGPRHRDVGGVPSMPIMPELREMEEEPLERVIEVRVERTAEQYGRVADETLREDPKDLDMDLLAKDNFNPEVYLKTKMAHSTEEEIRHLQESLTASRAATAADLQRNVFKNYAEFVLISKEISTLENDMLELKESLSEWKNMPSLLNIDDSGSATSVADRRRAARSSIADLRTLYASQLQDLHVQIEGSAKFVPAIPGRHIVSEFPDLWALNSATYKVEYAVHVVLLDDSVLVAKKRKKRTGGGGKLVTDRSWALGDLTIIDVKDTIDLNNVIKIRRGKEMHVFKTDTLSDKKGFLALVRQVSEELGIKKRKEREGEHERRKSVWTGDRISLVIDGNPMPSFPAWLADLQSQGIPGVQKDEKDLRWVSDFVDSLAVAIAQREWEEAVGLIEQAQGVTTAPASTLLPPRVSPLKVALTNDLLHDIADPTNRKLAVVKLAAHLNSLGAGVAARDAFLSMRTEVLRKRTRMIRFEGSISLYVSELALVTFTHVKHTAEWYLASWREHDMASGMVSWAKERIEVFATMFRRQVYGPDVDAQTIQESVQVTRLQGKRLLQDIGLDFMFLLDTLLEAPGEGEPLRTVASSSTAAQNRPPILRTPSNASTTGTQPLFNRNVERVRSPVPQGRVSPSPSQMEQSTSAFPTKGGQGGGKPPGPLPPRSRQRPMSGNLTPRPSDGG
ncbi:exocyst complex component exo84 [Tulasnella sp. JGI-2019a]|nr:exocyst complex component exo84 [Tulasnella sp. JGI-2019a]